MRRRPAALGTESPILSVARHVNLGLAFVLELAVYVAVALWAYLTVNAGRWLKVGSALGAVVVMAVLWSLFGAPSATVSLADPALVAFQSVWFALGVLALVVTGRRKLGIALAVLTVANLILIYHWHQQQG
ncbi:YrdB family protein [Frankia sp. AgB32]|uniref:YrdB family protein n=1 Tax=Frankia sp. AgB32 TaxID=631119 RepID=UPI00200DB287|nr:YrdB family protein [Frankia sp. AgB32]MCK9897091.1 YrdB family protein [Frankia sp. AgB32]